MICPRCGTQTDSWPCPNCGFPEIMRAILGYLKGAADVSDNIRTA